MEYAIDAARNGGLENGALAEVARDAALGRPGCGCPSGLHVQVQARDQSGAPAECAYRSAGPQPPHQRFADKAFRPDD
jgi:hypothetical protein